MNRVFVSGATGFLGYAVACRLLSMGTRVRVLVRSPQKAHPLISLGAEVVIGDIRDPNIKTAAVDIDTVIHCAAAIAPVSMSAEERYSVNVEGTRNLVDIFRHAGKLRRFVHVSTVAVVGETDPRNPADEEVSCRPLHWYGQTKLLAEREVLDAAKKQFPAVILRPMWIYGARSPLTVSLFRKIASRKLPIIGAAKNTMQPIAVDDVVAALLQCAKGNGAVGQVYNVAGPEIITVRDMCEAIADAVGTPLPKITIPLSVGVLLAAISESLLPRCGITPPITRQKLEFFRLNNSYSIERAKRDLHWLPKVSFPEGARTVAEELRSSQLIGRTMQTV